MKNAGLFVLLLTACFCGNVTASAQLTPRPGAPFEVVKGAIMVEATQPLMLVNNHETRSSALIIDYDQVAHQQVFKPEEASSLFGSRGEDGAVVMELNPEVELIRLEEVLERFNIPMEKRSLKVCINKTLVDPALFLADPKLIETVKITKQDVTAPIIWSFDADEEFINIITVKEAH